jgi:hypothetical protein
MIEERAALPKIKVCRKCTTEKPSSEFYLKRCRNVSGEVRTYLNPICKECFAAETKLWGAKNPERRKAICRSYQRRKSFGIDSSEYIRMHEKQDFACAICGVRDLYRRLDIDHDHETNKIRELLCSNCNNGLGRFQDSAELLRKAAEYLERHADPNALSNWVKNNSSVLLNKFTAVM